MNPDLKAQIVDESTRNPYGMLRWMIFTAGWDRRGHSQLPSACPAGRLGCVFRRLSDSDRFSCVGELKASREEPLGDQSVDDGFAIT